MCSVLKASAPLFLLPNPLHAMIARNWTVGEIMDLFINAVPGGSIKNTVDTLKSGNRNIVVTGIVTSMFPTMDVIRQAILHKANFIIVHEPSFYNHADETAWLEKDDVFNQKINLLNKHNIAVWRNHDYVHTHRPDGIIEQFKDDSGWKEYFSSNEGLFLIPPTTVKEVIDNLKLRFDTGMMRYIGDLSDTCTRMLYMPGAPGGKRQIESISSKKPDLVICGEIQEWETAEYVRDARAAGRKINLIVMGHIASEEPGSKFMADWIKKNVPQIPVTHVPSKTPFSFE